jgi:hypothetical protein
VEGDEEAPEGVAATSVPDRAAEPAGDADDADLEEDVVVARTPRGPQTTPFGSVWDSQLGTPVAASAAARGPVLDDEDFDEPEIPEYLIAEQRQGGNRGGSGGGRGARGGRSAYQSAMERERYGRGGGGGASGGINRYPDVSARPRSSAPPRDDRGRGRSERPAGAPPPPRSSNEPWSDVPPELEAMLRAQVAQKPAPSRPAGRPATHEAATADIVTTEVEASVAAVKPRTTRKPAAGVAAKAPAKPRAARAPKPTAAGAASTDPAATTGDPVADVGEVAASVPKATAKPRAARKPAATKAGAVPADDAAAAPAKRRTTRKAPPAETD